MARGNPEPKTTVDHVQPKVTWSFVWSLWWRWTVFSLAAAAIVLLIVILFLYGSS